MNKVLLIDKPAGWTSFDVVAKVRGALSEQQSETRDQQVQASGQKLAASSARKRIRVGHAGTLDPFATGLLIVLVGNETKNQDKYMKLDKEYEATLKLGYTSTTGDPEGTIQKLSITNYQLPTEGRVVKALKGFQGEIEQTPPAYSAIKVNGQRAYKLARAGKEVSLKPRKITIYVLSLMSYAFPELRIRVSCSSGTYIRTLAEDIGKALGTGAYLTELRRTKIGDFSVDDSQTIDSIIDKLR